ncbi:ABC transporter I family member 20 [Chlorella sorokiniana]|uniref:ABC transporter I family member 20 n=1 Tax=Chlorella sorokiniana TaxID=3076 RepID=A0A2P6TD76_CHLSO|nr:ABC transporter I family member 20 [Chlorella sorokiniana]|eukprot:PRW20596.1 ABC transporter I family member 20 [Chlorella sorokiniana]
MPVPLSVTNPKGKGLAAQVAAELPTEGPFARLQAEQQHAAAAATPGDRSGADGAAAQQQPHAQEQQQQQPAEEMAVETHSLSFSYPDIDGRPLPDRPPVVQDMSVALPKGATCLLIGPNGAGKTTLLKVLGGKHMVSEGAVRVLGQPPFHATGLTSSGALSYVGGNWERDIAFAGYAIPLAGDIPASQMLNSLPGIDPARRDRLIEVLDIDPTWRMHLVSDGQRRRVQIAMGLLKPFQVLLLDEITVDLDVLGRSDLMAFLKEECQQRGATIIYATHIFDGLESWPSHVMYVAGGRLQVFERAENVPELQQGQLLSLVERWLREEQRQRQAAADKQRALGPAPSSGSLQDMHLASWNNGWVGGRLASSLKHSANAVMRM